MLSNFLTLPLAFSQENQGVDRRAYFERAHESLGFLLQMGFMDHDLMSRLSKSEASMIQLITELALEMDALRFFEKNNVQRFGAYPKFSYHYTIWDNKVVDLITDAHHSIRVHFSEDQRIFQLHPNEPIRTAVTESELEKPIYINLKMIQNEQIPVDFAKAVSLMVHEYGHKLGNQKNQEAIDSMASKFEDYVRTRTIHENVNGVRFEALYFTRFEKYGEFLQNILQGEYRGVNVPPKIYPLNVYANQGVYVFANREGKIKDLTSVVVGNITKNKLVTYVDIPQYTFAKFDLVLAQSIDFSQSFNGEILIKVNANLLQLVLPFMNYKSYEPKEFQLYQKVFQTPNYESEFYGYQFELDSETLKTNKVSKTNLK